MDANSRPDLILRATPPGRRAFRRPTRAERAAMVQRCKVHNAPAVAASMLVDKTPQQAAETLAEIETWAASEEFAAASIEDRADTLLLLEPLRRMVGALLAEQRGTAPTLERLLDDSGEGARMLRGEPD